MILVDGTKLLISHRRLFAEDQPRFFAGTVRACEGVLAKVTGYSWSRDPAHDYQRKPDLRTKIVSLESGTLMIYELPIEVEIEELRVEQPGGHVVRLTDGRKFLMDLSERQIPGPGA